MLDKIAENDALTAPTQFIETGGRTLAYRSIGKGKPILLATRFRGTLDLWDPAFLNGLAENGFRVITFDYSGLGLSIVKQIIATHRGKVWAENRDGGEHDRAHHDDHRRPHLLEDGVGVHPRRLDEGGQAPVEAGHVLQP